MADLAFLAYSAPVSGAVQGRVAPQSPSLAAPPAPAPLRQDFRHLRPTTGAIADQVILKTGTVETPFSNGRVWLLREADGRLAWQGYTDAAGAYSAEGLELGIEYVAVAVDPTRQHKATGAGPVMSTLAPP